MDKLWFWNNERPYFEQKYVLADPDIHQIR